MQLTIAQARALGVPEEYIRMAEDAEPKPNKYHAQPAIYDGVRYDSKAEARRAAELDALVFSGAVAWWLRQVKFRLGPDATYRADFVVAVRTGYYDEHGEPVVVHAEDVKGVETAAFRKVRRLWAKYGPIPLHVISKGETDVIPPGIGGAS